MENERPNYWRMKNKEYAAVQTLYQVRGYLKSKGENINPQELLEYIDKALAEETESLDKRFPDKKA